MVTQSAFRLKHADPSNVIDECIGKVERLRTSDARVGLALDVSGKVGEREFWRVQHLRAADDAAPGATAAPAPAPPAPPRPIADPEMPPSAHAAPPGPAPFSTRFSPPGMTAGLSPAQTHARKLYAEALAYTGKQRCAQIGHFAREVYERDPEFYRTTYATDPRLINECEWLVPGETDDTHGRTTHPGEGGLHTGGYMLAIGLITDLVSGLILGIGSNVDAAVVVGVVGLTVGTILFFLGLLVVFISALIYAAN
jgi:hypothetical protein